MGDAKRSDVWGKAGSILQSSGGLITAVTVAILGFIGSNFLKDREVAENSLRERMQAYETNVRVYTELMSKREESESNLRKGMFDSMMESFMKPAPATMDEKVLNLELVAYNFHESLDLKPLFIYLDRHIRESRDRERPAYLDRLHKVAAEITRKQLLVIEGAGDKFDRYIDLDSLAASPGGLPLEPDSLVVEGITRYYWISVEVADKGTREIKVQLSVRTPKDTLGNYETNTAEFWTGFFDFPMIDNTRLSHDQRCSLVVNAFEEHSAEITLVCFPGTYASLKEKPYYQEVVQNLMNTNARVSMRP